MTQDEIKQIGELLDLKIGQLEARINERFTTLDQRSEPVERQVWQLDQKIQQLEARMNEHFASLDHKIEETKAEIVKSIADYVDESLMPILDQHIKRLEHLEAHTTHPPGVSPDANAL
jgi:phage shock protein A